MRDGGVQAGGWCALVGGAGTPQHRSSLCPSLPPDEVHVHDITVRSFFLVLVLFFYRTLVYLAHERVASIVSVNFYCVGKKRISSSQGSMKRIRLDFSDNN